MTNNADPDQFQKPTDLDLPCLLRQGMSCLAREGLTHCRLNDLTHTVCWRILISILGMSGYVI